MVFTYSNAAKKWSKHTGDNTKILQVPVIIGVLHIHIEWYHTIPSGSLLIG